MPDKLLSPSSGLSNSDLAKANAGTGDVIAGKTFYAGIKTLKTGAMANHGAWSGTFSGGNVGIPAGYHNGAGSVGVAGGNQGSWGTTINPGGSVTIPQGWHNGSGVVRANPATYNGYSMVELRAESRGNEYVSGNSTAHASGTIKWCPTGRVAYSPDDSNVYIEVTGYSGNAINYRWSAHNFGIRFNLVVIV